MAQSCICRLAASSSAQRQWRSLGARFITLHARCAGLHDLDVALPGRLRRGCSARPPPPLASRAQQPTAGRYASAARMAARAFISPTAFEQARGRRSGSGRWQGRVRRGRSLRSRPRNSVHRSVRPRVRSAPGVRVRTWVGMVVRFVCVEAWALIRVSVCPVCPACVPF